MEIFHKPNYQLFFNRKAVYRDMVADLVQSYKAIRHNMSLKVHFLDS
jgi:hypothetical protein